MSKPTNTQHIDGSTRRRARRWRRYQLLALLIPVAALAAACGAEQQAAAGTSSSSAPDTSMPAMTMPDTSAPDTTMPMDHGADHPMADSDRAAAMLATAAFQDVSSAEAAGYGSSIDTLGCFQDPELGGMGVHYINPALMDDKVDITKPEALVYELDAAGHITGLVAHEYIVPIDAWTSPTPPQLFGMSFHKHPTLPLWVLHTWLWKDNPSGVFADWNPAVRLCPAGVPIFGKDLPVPAPAPAPVAAPPSVA